MIICRKISWIAAVLAVTSVGCANQTPDTTIHKSAHTVKELCDAPSQFFSSNFDFTLDTTSSKAGPSPATPIDDGGYCIFSGPNASVGNVFLSITGSHTEATIDPALPTKTFTVDGIKIIGQPKTIRVSPSIELHNIELVAIDNHWEAKLNFPDKDDATDRAGAQILVGILHSLT